MKIAASFLGCAKIDKFLNKLNFTDIDFIHVDVMDGKYVKNKTMPLSELENITYYTRKRLDVHLMVLKPLKWIDNLASLNVECVTIHTDIKDNIEKVINLSKKFGIKVGIAINPSQEISEVYDYLDKIDRVLIMSVEPGFSGQKFIETTPLKVQELRNEITKRNLKTQICVDGGINFLNAKDLKSADILVSGSTIMNSDNYQDAITKLRKCASE